MQLLYLVQLLVPDSDERYEEDGGRVKTSEGSLRQKVRHVSLTRFEPEQIAVDWSKPFESTFEELSVKALSLLILIVRHLPSSL